MHRPANPTRKPDDKPASSCKPDDKPASSCKPDDKPASSCKPARSALALLQGAAIKVQPLPMLCRPDWASVARMVRESGPMLLAPDIPAEAGRVSLHRLGVRLVPVRVAGALVAYRATMRPPTPLSIPAM